MYSSSLRITISVIEKIATLTALGSMLIYTGVLADLLQLQALSGDSGLFLPIVLVSLLVGVFGIREAKKIHKRKLPYLAYILCAVVTFFSGFLSPSMTVALVFSVLLFLVSVWNCVLELSFTKKHITTIRV